MQQAAHWQKSSHTSRLPWLQVLVVIRHGESEYNAAVRQTPGWQDPKIFDPSLTAVGCKQAMLLRAQLASELQSNPSLVGSKDILWVSSPLRRCLQTLTLSCPVLSGPFAAVAGAARGATEQIAEQLRGMRGASLPRIKVVRCE
jgi:broad specificity phosphatase PhoE